MREQLEDKRIQKSEMDFRFQERKSCPLGFEEVSGLFTFNLFAVLDALVALLLYIGNFPAPNLLLKIIIGVLIFKAFISIVTIPFEIPGLVLVFGLTDILASILLFLGTVPGPDVLKIILASLILVKGILSIAMPVIKIIG